MPASRQPYSAATFDGTAGEFTGAGAGRMASGKPLVPKQDLNREETW